MRACAVRARQAIFTGIKRETSCGKSALIYSNAETKIDEKISVKATDQCSGVDSEIQLTDADGKIEERFPVPDGKTKTIHVLVRSGHWLNFVCNGTSGGCSYSVTSE